MSEMLSSDSQSIDTSFCEFCPFSIVRVSHSYSAPTSDPLTGCRKYIWQIQFVHIQMLKDFVKQDCIIGNKYTSPLECSSLQILLPPCTTACYLSLYSPYCTVFYTVFMVWIPLCYIPPRCRFHHETMTAMVWILPWLGILQWYDYYSVGILSYCA